ncbi:MAG TPA: hypothetical protein VE954_42930 [Oligoflexus sp.]|uniref:hypothetical protein n=1 Tax=Oligoflexus sp. TaxID=1971216 RepID=UPI002D304B7F|nr:hypothetical protein [Oligoflexus sp.]HYX39898.1 hypothetical protein [Oligoflexus sp.]
MVLVKVLLHVAWIIPLFWGRTSLAVAMLLFVGLCYIKVFKFRQQLSDLAARGGDSREEATLRNALKRWHALTWLKER